MNNFLGLIILVVLGFFIGLSVGIVNGNKEIQHDAIKVGVAQYTLKNSLGEIQFQWITNDFGSVKPDITSTNPMTVIFNYYNYYGPTNK